MSKTIFDFYLQGFLVYQIKHILKGCHNDYAYVIFIEIFKRSKPMHSHK